jgi:proteasome lid subunit RPN8/RPN11
MGEKRPRQPLHLLGSGSPRLGAPPGLEESESMDEELKPNLFVLRLSTKTLTNAGVRILPTELASNRLVIPRIIFNDTLAELQKRSEGERESAATFSGNIVDELWEVSRVDFHHDLCDDEASALSIRMSEDAKLALYEDLAAAKLKLVATIHTHPAKWVGLSEVDRRNQISSRTGFWSLVVPNYGTPPWILDELGVHIRTPLGWYSLKEHEISQMVFIKGR